MYSEGSNEKLRFKLISFPAIEVELSNIESSEKIHQLKQLKNLKLLSVQGQIPVRP